MVSARSLWAVACLLCGCREALTDDLSRVDGPRVLAVRADPPEAAPGEPITLTALYVDASGELSADVLDWAFCTDRKPLTELGPVAPTCLARTGPGILPIDSTEAAALPDEGCRSFGPDRPAPMEGEPAGRPVDPDFTGGYYQPLRLFAPDVTTAVLGEVRIACGVADAPPDVSADFAKRYVPNAHPSIERLTAVAGDVPIVVAPESSEPVVVAAPGERVTLAIDWPSCARDAPAACEGAETYLEYDPSTRTNRLRREGVRVSWYATSGAFASEHTGQSEADADVPSSRNVWTAPRDATDVRVFVVVRDDRGGVGWSRYLLRVSSP